ncbi:hypothetical protein [Mycolicibacterium tusciae]|uniref:hypothetical protein n=1 Tax=Mycolicibacterium tusciae TaxID=75922 RepID=UPI00024A2D9F|nr:hypothetical protein [Mycolicibacterium tusciae]
MTEQNPGTGRASFQNGLATAALVLNMIALIASAMWLATFVLGHAFGAVAAGATSLMTFAARMTCYAMDGRQRRRGDHDVPVIA